MKFTGWRKIVDRNNLKKWIFVAPIAGIEKKLGEMKIRRLGNKVKITYQIIGQSVKSFYADTMQGAMAWASKIRKNIAKQRKRILRSVI